MPTMKKRNHRLYSAYPAKELRPKKRPNEEKYPEMGTAIANPRRSHGTMEQHQNQETVGDSPSGPRHAAYPGNRPEPAKRECVHASAQTRNHTTKGTRPKKKEGAKKENPGERAER